MKLAWERKGKGPALLLIHGLGYARWGWEPVVPLLAERFDVLLYDNRGIGESDAPPGPYTAAAMAEDAVQVLDEAGVERAHVLGTSLGGMVAIELALAHPQRIDRLVLVSTTPGGAQAYPMPQVTVELMQRGASLREYVENALSEEADEALVDTILEHRERTAQPLEAWSAQAAAGATFDAFDRLAVVEAPTLILHGTADRVVDARNSELLGERIRGARVELVQGGGHIFFYERPQEFCQTVTEFLA